MGGGDLSGENLVDTVGPAEGQAEGRKTSQPEREIMASNGREVTIMAKSNDQYVFPETFLNGLHVENFTKKGSHRYFFRESLPVERVHYISNALL